VPRSRRRGLGQAVGDQEAPQVVAAGGHRLGSESVDLVQHDDGHGVVGGERTDVVLVEQGVGILLRIGDPDEDVDEFQVTLRLDAVRVDPRVEVGQVQQHQTVQASSRTGHRQPV
jgi:hypothetical protein